MIPDFIVRFDPDTETKQQLTDKIFYNLFIRRVKFRKPCVIFIGAESGEGKSYTALKIEERLLYMQGLDIKQHMNAVNVYCPIEYGKKLNALLFDKELKKVNLFCIHESRDVINAKDWNDFLPRAIADVNAQSRTIKRMITIIISQFIRDITTDVRYTLNYYCKVYRPLGKHPRLFIYKMWKDDRDLEKPKLKKRRIRGVLVYPSGKRRVFIPEFFEMLYPEKEVIEEFEKQEYESKGRIIKNKMNKLIKKMELEVGDENPKVEAMVDFYTQNQENLKLIGRQGKRGFKLNPEFTKMHDLGDDETKEFKRKIVEKLKKMGIAETEEIPEVSTNE